MGRKLGAMPTFWGRGSWVPIYHSLAWIEAPCQVASWSIQPYGHNRHGPKIGVGSAAFLKRWSWVPI